MNALIDEWLVRVCLVGAIGLLALLAVAKVYVFLSRHFSAAVRRQSAVGMLLSGAFVMGMLLYGGSKGPSGAPPIMLSQGASPTMNTTVGRIERWSRRGAWEDGERIDFAADWCFPAQTNHLRSVELWSQGKVYADHFAVEPLAELPVPLALVPGESEVVCSRDANGDYRFDWTHGHPNRAAGQTLDGSIVLHRNGNISLVEGEYAANIVRSLPFAHDGFGQDEEWIRANFEKLQAIDTNLTSAVEVLTAGYAGWANAMVGENLTNGLYLFTAAFPAAPPEAVLLTIGDYSVAVTNAGEYSFVLEKGVEYAFGTRPFCEEVEYSMQDDMASDAEIVQPMLKAGNWDSPRGVWSEDGGWNYLCPESAAEYGLCLWMPVLRGELDVEHLFPNDFPAIFTATVTDYRRTNDVQCSWWTDTQNIEIVSPTSMTTQVKCSLVPSWAEFELEVEASICGQPLLSRLSATYGTNSVPQIRISIQGADHVWKNQPISDANKRIYSVLIDADAPTSGVFSIEFVAGRNHANVSYLCPTEFVVSQTHMLPYERPFAVVEGVCASEECGEESFRWTFETEDGEILSGMKRFTVCEVESVLVWSKVSSEVTEPVAFPGQMTSVFCITNSFEVDRHYPIFFCDVVDTNLNIAPYSVEYRVKTRPEALTIHNAQTQLQLIDGPNCGELRSAYGKIGYYDTPCSGGVYKVSAFYGDSPGTETILVLPPAGASVDDVVSNDIIRAEDFVNAIEWSVPAIKRQSPMFGLQWFNDDGMGDYLGRVDSLPKPTIWAYNQVNDETGMGAVATWVGLPVRIAKASNFLVGYASTRIGVWDISRWAAQFIGTSNDESASISWRLGVSVAEGTNYNSVVGIAATNMWKVADEKVKRLWPNYELTDNHTTGLNSVDYNFNFISPGFTERGR